LGADKGDTKENGEGEGGPKGRRELLESGVKKGCIDGGCGRENGRHMGGPGGLKEGESLHEK